MDTFAEFLENEAVIQIVDNNLAFGALVKDYSTCRDILLALWHRMPSEELAGNSWRAVRCL